MLVFLSVLVFAVTPVSYAQKSAYLVETKWGGDAEMIYDEGFMHMLMKHPGGGTDHFDRFPR